MKISITFVSLFFAFLGYAQKSNSELETEIASLKDSVEIKNYWIKIHEDDQSVRGKATIEAEKMDRQNIRRMVLMFKYHGYPTSFCYGCNAKSIDQNNFTPNIVITHNVVTEVGEFIFPILQKAYNEGKANEFWYIHNLQVLVRNRYGRDFCTKSKENIPLYIEKLNPYLEKDISYDLTTIDSLFNDYDTRLNSILSSKLIFSDKKKGFRNNIYRLENGTLFWQKIYPDNSFNFPQEIYYDTEKGILKFVLLDGEIKDEILLENIELFK